MSDAAEAEYERVRDDDAPKNSTALEADDQTVNDGFERLKDDEARATDQDLSMSKLNLNRVYEKIGGFGRLQALLLIIIAIVRNFG